MGAPPKKTDDKPKDRVNLRLFNTIVIFDDYVVAKDGQSAREALLAALTAGEVTPMEIVAKEVTMINSIRASKTEEKPLVAADVTDEEFETLKGITNIEAFNRFYTRTK